MNNCVIISLLKTDIWSNAYLILMIIVFWSFIISGLPFIRLFRDRPISMKVSSHFIVNDSVIIRLRAVENDSTSGSTKNL